MHRFRQLLGFVSLVALAGCIATAATPPSSGTSPDAAKHWTADNGNGTYSNPLFYEEFEDPDIIRVGEDYYLAGTTMHMNPAVQLMHSKDLVNWELAGYCMDRLDLGPAFRLEDGRGIYGRGIWAPCIRYHNGMFYVFSNVNGAGLQVFRSKSIHGPWERNQLPGRHDLSVLFDDDGKIYIISGNRSPYPIEELAPDLKSFVPGVRHQLDARMGEGHHLYKIKGKYYDISAIPGATTDQMVARADSIDGPWTVERMVQGESLGVPTVAPARVTASDRGLTLHQGGMGDTPSGEWWSVIMSDHGSAGRMVALVPITWDNGFPLIGLPGNLRKAPNTWIKPNTGVNQDPKPAFIHDDNFDSGKLNPHWQWNHVPDDTKWSITEKPGVLRLHSLPADNFYAARNSICQRPPAPESIMTVELDTSGMVAGDTAGLALLSSPYAWIGVVKSAEGTTLQMLDNTGSGGGRRGACPLPRAQAPHDGPGQSPQASLAARPLQLRHRPGHLQLERRWQGIHASGQSLHHDLPVDDLPGRSPVPVPLQHFRPARRLCRLRQLHGRRAAGAGHRTRDSHGQDHRADQRRRRQLPGRRHAEQHAGECRGRRERPAPRMRSSRSSIWAWAAWR